MEKQYSQIISQIGEDVDRQGLVDTPKRAAKAMSFLTSGYQKTLKEVVNGAIFDSDADDIVIAKNIELYSMCENHLLPFIGKFNLGYLPTGKVLGCSKVARIGYRESPSLTNEGQLNTHIACSILEV